MTRLIARHIVATVIAGLLGLTLIACNCPGPATRHAETEWQLRHQMPTWGPHEWNAWEAELASAVDKPAPDPPMFPDPDGDTEPDDSAESSD